MEPQREHQKEEAVRQEFEQSCAAGLCKSEVEEQETALMARRWTGGVGGSANMLGNV